MTTNRGRVRVEQSARRVRALLGGEVVVDSIRPSLVWEGPTYPKYYFPQEDLRAKLESAGVGQRSPSRGTAETFDVVVGERRAPGAALRYADSPFEELRDLVVLDWNAMDHWFEEDEEVFGHARNPYWRVDVLASSRHVRVELDGVTVADSTSPHVLFETSLPARFYLPKTHVRMDLLTRTDKHSLCPYKGRAEYWTATVGDKAYENIAWSYRHPLFEAAKIAGLICFYNEKVDLIVDGVLQERPKSRFA